MAVILAWPAGDPREVTATKHPVRPGLVRKQDQILIDRRVDRAR